ncbi:MAG: type II toxin-antitoxin system RelE/ParE family toxin [Pseudonocardiaceae bacterium]
MPIGLCARRRGTGPRATQKLRELRFHLQRSAVRLTYWIAPSRRIVLLTMFRKSRMREEREIDRARRALRRV